MRGDLNSDGLITAVDALAVLVHVVGKTLPPGWIAQPNGETNCDGVLTAVDAQIILARAVGKDVSEFCIGATIQFLRTASSYPWDSSDWDGICVGELGVGYRLAD